MKPNVIVLSFLISLSLLIPVNSYSGYTRGSSNRSSSSRSFSRPTYKKSNYTFSRSKQANNKKSSNGFSSSKQSNNPQKKNKVSTSKNKGGIYNVTKKQKNAKAKELFRQKNSKNKFKRTTTYSGKNKSSTGKVNSTSYYRDNSTTLRRNPIVEDSFSYDRGTFYNRRSVRYASYNPPVYMYDSSPSFGVWDATGLWFMLDNINDRNQARFAYNHQNDPGYVEWRREANRLAESNDELRRKLNQLDNSGTQFNGQKIDPSYIPEGVDADILLSTDLIDNIKPTINICTGLQTGRYFHEGVNISNQLSNVDVSIKVTSGSLDNLKFGRSGRCDAAFVQRDVYDIYTVCSNDFSGESSDICDNLGLTSKKNTNLDFTRIGSPMSDTVLAICSTEYMEDAKSIGILNGSGSLITWENFSIEHPNLNKVELKKIKFNNGKAFKDLGKEYDCLLQVTGTETKFAEMAQLSVDTSKFKLINITSDSILSLRDPFGDPVYKRSNIDMLGNLHKGMFFQNTDTVSVPVDFVVSNKWKKENNSTYEKLVNIINNR